MSVAIVEGTVYAYLRPDMFFFSFVFFACMCGPTDCTLVYTDCDVRMQLLNRSLFSSNILNAIILYHSKYCAKKLAEYIYIGLQQSLALMPKRYLLQSARRA